MRKILVSMVLGLLLSVVPLATFGAEIKGTTKLSPECPFHYDSETWEGVHACYVESEDEEWCYYVCYYTGF